MILSKAASTAADGPAFVVRREDVAGEGDGVASGDLATVFGVGEGLGATVRVRLDGEVLLFCASAAPAHLAAAVCRANGRLHVAGTGGRLVVMGERELCGATLVVAGCARNRAAFDVVLVD